MAARIRVLAEGVKDLVDEIARMREAAPRVDLSKVGPEARSAVNRLAAALEVGNSTLETTNRHLATLAQRPIIGMLGGGAETELQRLLSVVDLLRKELEKCRRTLVAG